MAFMNNCNRARASCLGGWFRWVGGKVDTGASLRSKSIMPRPSLSKSLSSGSNSNHCDLLGFKMVDLTGRENYDSPVHDGAK